MNNLSKLAVGLLAALASPGCGGAPPAPAGGADIGPHGGPAVALPAGQGYGEVVVERGRSAGRMTAPRLAVYFLGPDLKTPLAAAPTGVRIQAIPPEGGPSTVTLAAEPDPHDAAGSARFASAPGGFDYDELRGELTATVDGRRFTAPFAFR